MIPLKLHIKNFLSYGAELQTIDFTPYNLICLSGKNGHGKSALLDAITWALWGVARKTATSVKPDQGLLRLGENHMMVILDFELGKDLYRIRREFTLRAGKAHSNLDFGIINPQTNSYVPLTEKTSRNTQHIIDQTINLDCETFINSAFIRQGQSHSFSKKSAAERKEIFATILGLNQYETIKKKALEKARETQLKEKTIIALQEKINQELTIKAAVEESLKQTGIALAEREAKEQELQEQLKIIAQEQEVLKQRSQERDRIIYQEESATNQMKKLSEKLEQTRLLWRTWHKKRITLAPIETLYAQRQQLINQIAEHIAALKKQLSLKEEMLKLKESVQQRKVILEQEGRNLFLAKQIEKEKIVTQKNNALIHEKDLEKTIIEMEKELQDTTQAIARLLLKKETYQKVNSAYGENELLFEKRKAFYQKYSAHCKLLHTRLKEIGHKQELASQADAIACPLCEQGLSTARRRFLQQQYSKDHERASHQYQRLVRILTTLKPTLVEQHAAIAHQKQERDILMHAVGQLPDILKKQDDIAKSLNTIRPMHADAVKKRQECELLVAEWEKVQKNFDAQTALHDPIVQELMIRIAHQEKELGTVAYVHEIHQKDEQQLSHIQQQITIHEQSHQESLLQEERKKNVITLCKEIKKLHQEIENHKQALALFIDITQKASNLDYKKRELDAASIELKKLRDAILEGKGRLLNECAKIACLEKEYKAYQEERILTAMALQDYTAIAQATGKDGIQAYLIEEAIPEVEQEANLLLSRLCHNNAQISFESLRDLKGGGSKETLDLKISDDSGTRPYEMFSGGEAFRIDFALRIALSKLLARRAGTALQTLIIDEGFGSQDEEGLNNLMEAIHAIQEDFQKVIIVSHLDTMKDQFPVHFVIHKGAMGSVVSVMQQG